MTRHMTGTREECLAAWLELFEAEKELTRRSDELVRRRQELPGGGARGAGVGTLRRPFLG